MFWNFSFSSFFSNYIRSLIETIKARISGDQPEESSSADAINGGRGNDKLNGDQADNEMSGGAGHDRMYGRDGDDSMD
ncbi:MAG: Ca2+-binding RTX toxin-like protein, partial [Alphaproteobacteria bacterium]